MVREAEPDLRRVDLADGWTALVGKTSHDNDRLTFRVAFPQDTWLHVKGCPGSHVVLHHASDRDPPRDVLTEAARLAVYHSKARAGGRVAVTVARVADLRKPKGAPAGQVEVRKGRTLTVDARD